MNFLLQDAVSPWVSVFIRIILSLAVIGADVQGDLFPHGSVLNMLVSLVGQS